MVTYYDTSCMAKLYVPEEGSQRILRHVADDGKALLYTPLHNSELRNAIALKVFRGEIEQDEMNAVFLKLESDIQSGRLIMVPTDWPDVFCRTNQLSAMYTAEEGCRTLDILHVALASSFGCHRFITNDERQRNLARRVGLDVDW